MGEDLRRLRRSSRVTAVPLFRCLIIVLATSVIRLVLDSLCWIEVLIRFRADSVLEVS